MTAWVIAWIAASALASAAHAKDSCLPPVFYTSLPRDSEWYYGVARDSDTETAREHAIRNLGKQVTGDLEGWKQPDVDALAGPGRDRWEVAAHVGRLLPTSTLLSGWEQDDFERCDGYSYVLVRIEKERVERFITQNKGFRADLSASFDQRLKKVEKSVSALEKRSDEQDCRMAALNRRLDRLNGVLGKFSLAARTSGFSASAADDLDRRVSAVRQKALQGGGPEALEGMLAGIEGDYGRLLARMQEYQATHDRIENGRLVDAAARNAPRLKAILADTDAGKAKYPEIAEAIGLYQGAHQFRALRAFCDRVLAKSPKPDLEGHDDFVAYMGVAADISLKDEDRLLADGEKFLKNYPGSNMYEAVRAQMDGVMALKRLPSAATATADLTLPPLPAPDPCAGG